jgi:hypothetical protein
MPASADRTGAAGRILAHLTGFQAAGTSARMSKPPPVFIALHVPKCAGRTIENHLREHLDPASLWIPRKRWRKVPPIYPPHYAPPLNPDTSGIRAVTGHFIGQSVERLFPGRTLYRSVLLREPLGFHLSYFNYRSMRYLSEGLATYSFDDHVRSQPDDPISHFLLERWLELPRARLLSMPAQRKYEILNDCLAKFWFVGDLGYCNELLTMMCEGLGISAQIKSSNTKEQWQAGTNWKLLTKDQLTPDQIALVAQRTRLDRALWETWKNARLDTGSVVPVPLPANAGAGLALHEVQRPYHSLVRRLKRGWN